MARILVVDDSSVMRRNIKNILESEGHEVVAEAADGREVLACYINNKPDIVTMDISMPIVDGISALKILMKSYPDAKVIMVSALGQKQNVLEAIKLGAKSYIVKPVERDKVIEIVGKVLSR